MQQIGRYQIQGELGRGAMGVVYRAQDPAIGRTIAIKSIRLADLTDPAERDRMRERLFREAQSAGVLSHPNIVTIYDILEEDGLAYIFMELVNGPTLEAILGADQAPSREFILGALRQTAAALDYAHRKGIVHRDIKPANIMVDDAGQVKITDFGVARIVSSQLTQGGMMMGTPSYMPPEQIQGVAVEGTGDQFALAVIAYEILTGEKPFAGDPIASLLYKIVREDPVAPQRLNSTLAPELEPVLRKALAKDPASRFPSCSEFVSALEAALDNRPGWVAMPRGAVQDMPTLGATPVPPVPPPPPAAAPASGNHTLRNVVLAVCAVVVLALALILARNSMPLTQGSASQDPAPSKPSDELKPAPAPPTENKPPPAETPETKPAEPPTTQPAAVLLPRDYPVQIMTSPGGAQIAMDGAPFCTSPCTQPVARGRHVITVRAEGYREARRVVEIPEESNIIVDLEHMMGTLSVTTTPPGATVYIDGQPRPEKTPYTFKLTAGPHKLRVERDNLKADEEIVEITDGGLSQRRYKLE